MPESPYAWSVVRCSTLKRRDLADTQYDARRCADHDSKGSMQAVCKRATEPGSICHVFLVHLEILWQKPPVPLALWNEALN